MGAKKIAESLTEAELVAEISRVITEATGVQLGQKQVPLVQGRLSKRMRDLKIADPLTYSRFYNTNHIIEAGILTSLLTTHHTYFFREFQHFEFLLKESIPALIKSHREKGIKTIRIWSAACSRGQEVYSLAMFLKSHLSAVAPDMAYEIIGSDICEESITIANNGVYSWEELRIVPSVYLQGNWKKGSGEIANYVRASEELRAGLSFRLLNLQNLNSGSHGLSGQKFDLIFCRNVFIYFNHAQIKKITGDILKLLNPSGHLFVGLSESLNGLGLPIDWVGPSIYGHRQSVETENLSEKLAVVLQPRSTAEAAAPIAVSDQVSSSNKEISRQPMLATVQTLNGNSSAQVANSLPAVKKPSRKLRVLCVDDSPTVTLLLTRILTPAKGFEVVGIASDGIDAAEKVKLLKPDIITLDIHMPRMTGVEFLEKHFKDLKTPVVIVSSVPREDSKLAYRCLELGASDYIEKPSLVNLERAEEELIFKLTVAEESWRQSQEGNTRLRASDLDNSFRASPKISSPDGKLRVIVCSFSSRELALILLKGFRGTQPGTLLLIEGAGDLFQDFAKKCAAEISAARANEPKSINDLTPGSVHFMELEKGAQMLLQEGRALIVSCLVVAPMSRSMIQKVLTLSANHLIVEDQGSETPPILLSKAHLVVPVSSFVYESDRFLAEKLPSSELDKGSSSGANKSGPRGAR